MTSSIVSSILLFLLLLLMSPHMNEAFGAQIELGKLEKTNHPDQVMVQRIPRISIPRRLLATPCQIYGRCKRSPPAPLPTPCPIYTRCKHPPLPSASKGTNGLGH